MTTENATPEQYFFSRSRKRNHPNFKKMLSEAVDIEIMEERTGSKKG